MNFGTVLLVFLILLLIGAFPSRGYGLGYYGHGGIGLLLLIVILFLVFGR